MSLFNVIGPLCGRSIRQFFYDIFFFNFRNLPFFSLNSHLSFCLFYSNLCIQLFSTIGHTPQLVSKNFNIFFYLEIPRFVSQHQVYLLIYPRFRLQLFLTSRLLMLQKVLRNSFNIIKNGLFPTEPIYQLNLFFAN